MPKSEATLIIKLKDAASRGLKGIGGALQKVREHALQLAIAIGALTAAAFKMTDMASQAKEVETAFKNLAASQGQDAKEMLANMKRLSNNTVSDLKLMQQANNALLLGLPVDRFGDMLTIARSAAKATGESMEFMLRSIVTGLGRGSKLMLDNLGIVFDLNKANDEYAASLGKVTSELTDAERKQAFINKALEIGSKNAKLAGAGTISFRDRIQQLTASLSNLSVELGEVLLPAFTGVANFLANSIIPSISGTIKSIGVVLGAAAAMVVEFTTSIAKLDFSGAMTRVRSVYEAAAQDLTTIRESTAQKFNEIEQRRKEEEAQIHKDTEKIKTDVTKKEVKKRVTLQQAATKALEFFKRQEVQATRSSLNTIATLQNQKSKELVAIGRAAAMAQAIINTAEGVTLALAKIPPPAGFILAGLVAVAGAAQVATIAGTQLAEGGIVKPQGGGMTAQIAEAGKPEAVIPLEDEEAQDKLSGVMGNNITINVNGGLLGDESSARELAQAIDSELLKLRRSNESNAFQEVVS